jgi:hypothetical protein
VQAFLCVSTQWRMSSAGGGGVAGMGGGAVLPIRPLWIGLDYAAVRVALEAEGIAITTELWRGLRIMEDEACATLNRDE